MLAFIERERAGLKQHWMRIIMLLTCLTMILVLAQQGGTITTQRNLIQLLWDDSKQLNQIRVQELVKKRDKMLITEPHAAVPDQKTPEQKSPAQKPPAAKAPTPPSVMDPTPFSVKPARVLLRI